MKSRKVTAAIALAATATTLAACSKTEPKEEVSKALTTQTEAKEQSMVFSVELPQATMDSIKKNMEKESKNYSNAKEYLAGQEKILAQVNNTSLKVQVKSKDGKTLNSMSIDALKDANLAYSLINSDKSLLEVFSLDSGVFGHLDLNTISTLYGFPDANTISSLKGESAPKWLKPVVDGKWFTLDGELAKTVKSGMETAAKSSTGINSKLTSEQFKKLTEAYKVNLLKNSTFSREGDQITVKTDLNKMLTQAIADNKAIAPELATKAAKSSKDSVSSIPTSEESLNESLEKYKNRLKSDAQFESRLTVEGEKIKKIEANALQFMTLQDPSKLKDKEKKDYDEVKDLRVNGRIELGDSFEAKAPTGDVAKITEKDLNSMY